MNVFRSYLKKVFWPKLFVGRSAQILEILEYSSGLILAAAAILTQNPFFEMASSVVSRKNVTKVMGCIYVQLG